MKTGIDFEHFGLKLGLFHLLVGIGYRCLPFLLQKGEILKVRVCNWVGTIAYFGLKTGKVLKVKLDENCSLLETDNVHKQISMHIFAPNGGCCLLNEEERP